MQRYYIIHNELTGLYKLGICKNRPVEERLKKLQNESGMTLNLVFKGIEDEDELEFVERIIHKYYEEYRRIGEWFALSKAQIMELINWFDGNGINEFVHEDYADFENSNSINIAEVIEDEDEPLTDEQLEQLAKEHKELFDQHWIKNN